MSTPTALSQGPCRAPDALLPQTAFVSLDPTPSSPGKNRGALRTAEILRSLARLGHGLQLFGPHIEAPAPEVAGSATIHRLPVEPGSDTRSVEEACLALNTSLHRDLEALVTGPQRRAPVRLFYERHSRWSYAGLEWARSRQIPSILEVDGALFDEPRLFSDALHEEAALVISRRAVAAATTTIATSEGVADWIRSLGVPDLRLHVVPEGANPDRFAAVAAAAPVYRHAGAALTIGFAGRLSPWYGLPVLFEAFAHLPDRVPADRLLVLGQGPERPFFDRLAADLGISGQVIWESGDTEDLRVDALASMDVVVAPLLSPAVDRDGLGQLMDCMAAARPIISTRLSPIQSILEHGHSAWLVRPGDASGLEHALGLLRRSPALRTRLAHAAHAALRARHTWNHVVGTILGHLESDQAGGAGPGLAGGWQAGACRLPAARAVAGA